VLLPLQILSGFAQKFMTTMVLCIASCRGMNLSKALQQSPIVSFLDHNPADSEISVPSSVSELTSAILSGGINLLGKLCLLKRVKPGESVDKKLCRIVYWGDEDKEHPQSNGDLTYLITCSEIFHVTSSCGKH
jgi:hypothetical protein